MFSVKETPWHELGEVLAGAPTMRDALSLGGLDFDVELDPMIATFIQNGVTMNVPVPDAFAVRRTDRNDVLGTVGPSYHALQNRDAFAVLEPLVDAGIATIETGGSLRGGRDVWMMVKFNIDDAKVRDILRDEVEPFGLISNNHNGTRKVVVQETPIRVVCANTLGFALRKLTKAITVRHTSNVKERTIDAAAQLFGDITKRYQAIADQYAAMKATTLSEKQFAAVVLDVIAPLPGEPKERKDNIAKAAHERATDRAMVKRNRLTDLWTDGDGHVGDMSAWEAYQGAVQSLDHDADIWKSDNRLESLFDGQLSKWKQDVVEAVVNLCVAA